MSGSRGTANFVWRCTHCKVSKTHCTMTRDAQSSWQTVILRRNTRPVLLRQSQRQKHSSPHTPLKQLKCNLSSHLIAEVSNRLILSLQMVLEGHGKQKPIPKTVRMEAGSKVQTLTLKSTRMDGGTIMMKPMHEKPE